MDKATDRALRVAHGVGACLAVLALAGCHKKAPPQPPPPPPPHVQVVDIGADHITTTRSCEVTAGGQTGACTVVSCSPGAHIENNACAPDGPRAARPAKCTIVDGARRTNRC